MLKEPDTLDCHLDTVYIENTFYMRIEPDTLDRHLDTHSPNNKI